MWNRPTKLSKMDDLDKNEVNLLSYDPENGGQTKMEVTTTFKVCTELDKMDFYTLVKIKFIILIYYTIFYVKHFMLC